MLTDVAVLVWDDQVTPFELGLLCEAFGVDRREHGVPVLDFAVCAPERGPLSTRTGGFGIVVEHGLQRARSADLVAVPAMPTDRPPPAAVVAELQAAERRGATVLSVCSGAFALGYAGLLDGRQCTTHWMHTDELRERFPDAVVVPDVLYVDTGTVVTSAGTAAGIDACLHVWRREHGAGVATAVARRMVVPPQRDGGQAQFVARPLPECEAETLGPLLAWALEHLAEDLSVERLARESHMSTRTFARRFRAETGTTPHHWVTRQRVREAEVLLERTDGSVDWVAGQVGFGNAATLRHHFGRVRGISPQRYRQQFAS